MTDISRKQRIFLNIHDIVSPPTKEAAGTLISFIKGTFKGPKELSTESLRARYIREIQKRFLEKQVISVLDEDKNKFGLVNYIYLPPLKLREKFPDTAFHLPGFDEAEVPAFMASILWDDSSRDTRFLVHLFPIRYEELITKESVTEAVYLWGKKNAKVGVVSELSNIFDKIVMHFRNKLYAVLKQYRLEDYIVGSNDVIMLLKQRILLDIFLQEFVPVLNKVNIEKEIGLSLIKEFLKI